MPPMAINAAVAQSAALPLIGIAIAAASTGPATIVELEIERHGRGQRSLKRRTKPEAVHPARNSQLLEPVRRFYGVHADALDCD